MPFFSERSETRLSTADEKLQQVFHEVVKYFDCSVICGHRGQAEQDVAFKSGKSKLAWPGSKHNSKPAQAVDVAPYPIDWNDIQRFHFFAGFVLGTARQMGIELRWGGDWNQNTKVNDEHFRDLVHFELVGS